MTSHPLPTLYSFRRCPYAMRARMALLYGGVVVELREVMLRDKPHALLTASPKGTVPVLIDQGDVIDESVDIMLWALGDSCDELDLSDLPAQLALVRHQDATFKPLLDRYKYHTRYPEQPQRAYRLQAHAFLEALEDRLQTHPYLFGARPGYANLGVFPFVRQFRFVDDAWWARAPYPALRAWLEGWLESERFEQAMLKVEPWREGQDRVVFGGFASR